MKKIAVFLLLLFAFSVYAEEKLFYNKDIVEKDGFYIELKSGKPFTGKMIVIFSDNFEMGAYVIVPVKNGSREGVVKGYYAERLVDGDKFIPFDKEKGSGDGDLCFQGVYVNNQLNGPFVNYNSYGNICFKGSFKNGLREGEYIWVNEVGQIVRRENYKNGFYNGKQRDYGDHTTGKYRLLSEESYKNGELNGLSVTYYNAETTEFELYYEGHAVSESGLEAEKLYGRDIIDVNNVYVSEKNQKLFNGEMTVRYKSGNYQKVNVVKGKREGKFIIFDKTGKIVAEGAYKNNELDGKYFEVDSNIKKETVYKSGLKKGFYKEYIDDRLFLESNMKDGNYDGLLKLYYSDKTEERLYRNGILYSTKIYKNGVLNGEQMYFESAPVKSW